MDGLEQRSLLPGVLKDQVPILLSLHRQHLTLVRVGLQTDVETQMASKPRPPYSRRAVVGAGATLAATSMTSASVQRRTVLLRCPAGGPHGKISEAAIQEAVATVAGLASQMDPPPDHGEQSCRGSRRLSGRKALITGGDSGMGRAAAIAFAREGADVAINYFPSEEPDAREVIEFIRAEERRGLALPGDIRDGKFCEELVRKAVEGLGGLDIVVSNAGRQQARQSFLELSSEDFDATMKTNIYAPFWIIKAALPHLKPGSAIMPPLPSRHTIRHPISTTTRRPRRRP